MYISMVYLKIETTVNERVNNLKINIQGLFVRQCYKLTVLAYLM